MPNPKQTTTCTGCGQPEGECYHLCPNSPAYYSPEQERRDDAFYGDDDIRERYAAEAADMALEDAYDEDECQGHPAGPFDPMGETVYCDGTCRKA